MHRKITNADIVAEKKRLFVAANTAWDKGDLREAFTLFLRAAKMGDASSQLDLGYFFDQGLLVKQNKKRAIEWYRRAYRQGDAGAANNIGTIYRERGNTRRMLWWFRRAAEMGDPDVLLDLGRRYENGLAVTKDREKAKQFYYRILASKHAPEALKKQAKARLIHFRKGQQ